MSTNIQIREMTIGDYEAVMDLWRNSPGVGLGLGDSRDNTASYLERNPGMSFVACDGDAIVGAVLCGTDGRRGYLSHLAVAPSHRKLGLGRSLVDSCMGVLRSAGIMRCNIFVYADNASGIAFWQKSGWQFWDERGVRAMTRETADAT